MSAASRLAESKDPYPAITNRGGIEESHEFRCGVNVKIVR